MKIELSHVELLALKKLALVCNAVAMSLSDAGARKEQSALTRVLVDVLGRADNGKDQTQPQRNIADMVDGSNTYNR